MEDDLTEGDTELGGAPMKRIADPNRSLAERADAVHDLLSSSSDPEPLPIGREVVAALAERYDPREALTAALHAADTHRREALEAAVARRDGPGDEQLTTALVELGRTEEAMGSVRDELRGKVAERPAPSPMFLGAWGIHLVKVFARLGVDRFEDFVAQTWKEDDHHGLLIGKALRAASIDGEQAEVRQRLLGSMDRAIMRARTGQSFEDFLGSR